MRASLLITVFGLVLGITSCSEQPAASEKKTEKPAEPVTGQSALFRMYQVARTWAGDAYVLRMNSIHVTDLPDVHGKAGAWRATFFSESRNESRTYTYSVIETEPSLHQGVFPGAVETGGGSNPDNKPFLISAVKIDTDAAYKTALKNAVGAAKQDPKLTIAFLLEKLPKFTNPTWRVIWGESVGTSGLSVYVDAFSGEFLETMH